ncbi:uncharacterized protein LOC128984693 [Macrosteles quadrilineatus]|uniref:uncharacterized protein LOC128984693 n=1 Tax=Macrosteles quadrilineatus TaxID=74068 RepID=UPI0023E16182|nr:uncharacterized protein LOC128984693 [Macrosteles quadrilineatus]
MPTLQGIRSAYREDLQASTAEIVFGQQLRLQGELLDLPVDGPRHEDPTDYVVRLRQHMSSIRPVQASRHVNPKTFIFQDLKKCTEVFLRDDSVKRALQPPYNGPYPVISRDEKSLVISQNGKQVRVSLDRVKPAYVLPEKCNHPTIKEPQNIHPSNTSLNPPNPTSFRSYTTRYGRNVKLKLPGLPVSAGG